MWPTLHLPNGLPPPPGAVDPRALHPSVRRLIEQRPESDLWTPSMAAAVFDLSDKMIIYACQKGVLEYTQPEGRGTAGKLNYYITTRSLIGYLISATRGLSESDISLLIACTLDDLSPKSLLALSNHIQARLRKQHPYELPSISDIPDHLRDRASSPDLESLHKMTLLNRLRVITGSSGKDEANPKPKAKSDGKPKPEQMHLFQS